MKIKKNDNVIVLKGKDKGKTGKVTRILEEANKIIIEGLNTVKKHQKARKQGAKGQILTISMPIAVSNVAIVDPKGGKASRIGYKTEGGKKVRVATKSGTTL